MSEQTPTVDGPVERAARTAARQLAGEHAGLEADVEAALQARDSGRSAPDQYFDPISLGALIVSAATLAWTVYKDLRKQTPAPSRDVVARRVRIDLHAPDQGSIIDRNAVIDLVVDDIVTNPGT